MKHFAFFILAAVSIISACKNDTPPPANAPVTEKAPEAAPQPAYTPEMVQQSIAGAKSTLSEMRNFLKSMDALPANVRKKHEADINTIREEIGSVIEKQQMMVDEFDKAPIGTGASDSDAAATQDAPSDAGQTGMPNLPAGTMQDYLESFTRYEEAFKAAKARMEEIARKKL